MLLTLAGCCSARTFNWSLSLLALLALIVFVIPLGLCLLLTHRTKFAIPPSRTFALTLIPFGIYLFLFYRVGSLVASRVVVEGSHSLGTSMARGVRGAPPLTRLYFACQASSMRCCRAFASRACFSSRRSREAEQSTRRGKRTNGAQSLQRTRLFFLFFLPELRAHLLTSPPCSDPVTDAQILAAERSLYRARLDLHQRTRSLTFAASSAAREADSAAGQSLLSRWTTSTPAATHLKSLQVAVGALETVEGQMVRDVGTLKKRKLLRELGRTVKGRLWLAAGWALSVYCVWRVFVVSVLLNVPIPDKSC
jgi:hypothetical protein